jgi:hypothetical protein
VELPENYAPKKTNYLEEYIGENMKQKFGIIFFTDLLKNPVAKTSRGRS